MDPAQYGIGYGPVTGYPPYWPTTQPLPDLFASTGRRIGAFVIDIILLAIVQSLVEFAIGAVAGWNLTGKPAQPGTVTFHIDLWGFWIGMIGWVLWFVVPTALTGATVGKAMVGARTVRESDGSVPGWGSALGRYGLLWLMTLPCYIPAFVCAVLLGSDPKHRGWHDRAAGTVVVCTR